MLYIKEILSLNIYMLNPTIIFGEPIETHFFEELMEDKNSKYFYQKNFI